MCYRCEVCKRSTEPGQQRFTYHIYRKIPARSFVVRKIDAVTGRWYMKDMNEPERQEIDREIQVCQGCYLSLKKGVSLTTLRGSKKTPVISSHTNGTYRGRTVTLDHWPGEVHKPTFLSKALRQEQHRCDVCGKDAKDGQITPDTILCLAHAKSARG